MKKKEKAKVYDIIDKIVHDLVGTEHDKETIGELMIDIFYYGQWG